MMVDPGNVTPLLLLDLHGRLDIMPGRLDSTGREHFKTKKLKTDVDGKTL